MSGLRPAFEDHTQPGDLGGDSSDDSDDEDELIPRQRHELSMRLSSIVDIIKKLYELGFKIRDPRLRPSSFKASLYQEVDPDTGVDLFEVFSEFDQRHVSAFLHSVRQGREPPAGAGTDSDFLEPRLAASITLRRKHFRYWEKHGKKLSLSYVSKFKPAKATEKLGSASQQQREGISKLSRPLDTGEQKTLLSGTEATKFHERLDDRTESETVISYAFTALDADGHGVELPNPPPEAFKGKDFVCPYCSVVCPARYGQRKAWRSVYDLLVVLWLLKRMMTLTSNLGLTSCTTSSPSSVRTRIAHSRINSTSPGDSGQHMRARSIGDYTDATNTQTRPTRAQTD